jgi:uncharacterized protein
MIETAVRSKARGNPPIARPDAARGWTQAIQPAALLTFVALAFSWTWGLWWIASTAVNPQSTALISALFIVSGFGPSLAGLVVVWGFDGRAGLCRWLQRCLTWRFGVGWYAMAFFGPPLAMVAALAIHAVLGGPLPPLPDASHIGAPLLQFGMVLFIGGPIGEEFGWRGYALPVLANRLGWRWASLIVGAVWGLWHLPLFFIPGMAQAQMPMALFMASSVAITVVLARMSVNTGISVLPAMLFHWAINAWPAVLPMIPNGGSVRPYVLVMSILFVIAVIVFLKPGPNPSERHSPQ